MEALFNFGRLFNFLHKPDINSDSVDALPLYNPYLNIEDLIKLRYYADKIRLPKTKRVATLQSGSRTSTYLGRGIDFKEVRTYQPGDDIRNMDWRVTARTGRAHTKLYEEERERPVYLLIDYSPTMFFGSRVQFKSTLAAKLAAIIAWSASLDGNRVGAFIATDSNTIEIRPKSNTRGVLPILHALVNTSCSTKSVDLALILQHMRKKIKPGSLIFILSDFYGFDDDAESHFVYLAKHTDIVSYFISDPLEKEPPPPNQYPITDGNDLAPMDTTSAEFCTRYREYFLQHEDRIKKLMRRSGVRFLNISTDDEIIRKLNSHGY